MFLTWRSVESWCSARVTTYARWKGLSYLAVMLAFGSRACALRRRQQRERGAQSSLLTQFDGHTSLVVHANPIKGPRLASCKTMLSKLRVLGVRRRAEAGEDNGNAASYGLAAIKGRFAGHKKPLNGLGVCSTA